MCREGTLALRSTRRRHRGGQSWTEPRKECTPGEVKFRTVVPRLHSFCSEECSRIFIISTFFKEASPNANKDHTHPQVCRAPTQKAPLP